MSAEAAYLDTSAVAKWYLNEAGSEEFVRFVQGLDRAVISTLTKVEMRCLLARRRRAGDFDESLENRVYSVFLADVERGNLQMYPVEDAHIAEAATLVGVLAACRLRTLDALHLAAAKAHGLQRIATADLRMAEAGEALGMEVVRFGLTGRPG